MRGYRYAALGLFAAAAALAANCGFPTSGESSGSTGGGTTTSSSTTTTTTTTTTSSSSSGACTAGETRDCYTGPVGTNEIAPCKNGTQTCSDGMWSTTCPGEITPQPQDCASTVDVDCLGMPVMCSGTPVWAEAFGAADADFINAVAVDSQGNILVTGGFSDTVNFADPKSTAVTKMANTDMNDDIFVAKYTSAGKLLWVQAYGGPGEDEGTGVAVDANDDVVVTGFFHQSVNFGLSPNPVLCNNPDVFVVKLHSADGTTAWANTYGDVNPNNATSHKAYAVAVGPVAADAGVSTGGDVAVVGVFNNSISFGPSEALSTSNVDDFDGFVVCLDGTGAYKWSQDVHGDPMQFDWLKGVAFDGMGNVVVTGVGTGGTLNFGMGLAPVVLMPPPPLGNHVLVAKYSPAGTPLWGQALGNDNPPFSPLPRHLGNAVAADATGDVVVVGAFVGTMQFPGGSMLTASGATDIFVAKLDPMGNATWSASFGGGGGNMMGGTAGATDTASAVTLDQFGNVVLAGSYQQMLAVGMPALTAKGATDAFAAKLDPTGKPIWSQGFATNNPGGTGFALGVAVNLEPTYVQNVPAGAPVVVGQFGAMMGDTISFGALMPLASMGSSDMFLASLAP